MDVLSYYFGFGIIYFSFISSTINAQDVCVPKSACSCEFYNGTGFDLSESAKSSFFTTQIFQIKMNNTEYDLSTYYYHPCYDAVPSINATTDPVKNTCQSPLSICRHTNTMNLQPNSNGTYSLIEGNYEFMGSSKVTNFSTDGTSIEYFNGPSSSVVMLVCAETDDKLQVASTEEPNKIVLAFYSRNACLRQLEEVGRSTGSTLLIIFFAFVIFYLVLGVCTKKFLMGATGIEVVPNLAFWSDLPNLMKDGWAFAVNGFKLPARGAGPATSPDPNSYDSI